MVRVNGRLHLAFADTSQLILKASDHTTNYKIEIFSVKLHFKRIIPVESVYIEFNKSLLSANVEYNFQRYLLYKTTVGANQRQVFLNQMFGNLIPNKLHILMVNQKASIGDVTMNSHYFNHFNLDDIRITANGLSVSDSEVTFRNTKKYSCLFKRVTEAFKTNKHSISYDNFNSGYTIIARLSKQ